MKHIKKYLEIIDESLIKKSNNAITIFNDFFYDISMHHDKKLWKNIMLYKETISSLAIDGVFTNYTKIIEWIDNNQEKNNDIWSSQKQAMSCFIGYIEGKKYLETNNKIDRKLFKLLYGISTQSNKGFRSSEIIKHYILDAPKNEREIMEYILELESFLNDKGTDLSFNFLVKMALAHFQFEVIHPFENKNGIIGRMVNNLYIIKNTNVNSLKIAPSSFIYHHKHDYFELLLKAEKNEKYINQFINYMILAACESCVESNNIMKDTDKIIIENINKLVDVFNNEFDIFNSQYVKLANTLLIGKNSIQDFLKLDDENKIEYWINILVDKEIIQPITKTNKNFYIFKNLWNYLLKLDRQFIQKS